MQCRATSQRSGQQCRRHALAGADVCLAHGAAAPQVRRKAAARVAEAQAMVALDRAGSGPVENPLEALQALAGEILAVKDWLGKKVETLENLRYRGIGGEQVRGELQAYGAFLDRTIRVLEALAKLNIDERLAVIEENQMRGYADAVSWLHGMAFKLLTGGDRLAEQVVMYLQANFDTTAAIAAATPGAKTAKVRTPALSDELALKVEAHRRRWDDAGKIDGLHRRIDELEGQLTAVTADRDRLALGMPAQLAITATPASPTVTIEDVLEMTAS